MPLAAYLGEASSSSRAYSTARSKSIVRPFPLAASHLAGHFTGFFAAFSWCGASPGRRMMDVAFPRRLEKGGVKM